MYDLEKNLENQCIALKNSLLLLDCDIEKGVTLRRPGLYYMKLYYLMKHNLIVCILVQHDNTLHVKLEKKNNFAKQDLKFARKLLGTYVLGLKNPTPS